MKEKGQVKTMATGAVRADSAGVGSAAVAKQGRPERFIRPTVLAVLAIVVAAALAAGWLTHFDLQRSAWAQRQEDLTVHGEAAAQVAAALLEADELTALRRLVMSWSRLHELGECRIVLADGRVLADATPARISATNLAARWPQGEAALEGALENQARVTSSATHWRGSFPVYVSGRGEAELIWSAAAPPVRPEAAVPIPAAAVGGAGLLLTLLVARQLSRRCAGLGLIHEALLSRRVGSAAGESLAITAWDSSEAEAFNGLLMECDELRRRLQEAELTHAAATQGGGGINVQGICDSLRQGIVLIDPRKQVHYCNGAAAVFLRGQREQIEQQPIEASVKDAALVNAIAEALDEQASRRSVVELRPSEAEGQSVLRVAVRPHAVNDEIYALLVIEDITQQHVAAEARNAFVAHATHELRTPLTNIRLYLETAIDEGDKDAKLRGECLNVISSETRRLERMVGDMLSLSEVEAGSFELKLDDVRLVPLFEELESDYQAQAREKKLRLSLDLPPKLPVLQADRDKFTLALHNVIGNAIKYTPESGRVTVSVEEVEGALLVEVRDTGPGIPAEEQERIFEKFYRTAASRDDAVQGSGLGLTLARELMRLHGGDITVSSVPGEGSVFTLSLPCDQVTE